MQQAAWEQSATDHSMNAEIQQDIFYQVWRLQCHWWHTLLQQSRTDRNVPMYQDNASNEKNVTWAFLTLIPHAECICFLECNENPFSFLGCVLYDYLANYVYVYSRNTGKWASVHWIPIPYSSWVNCVAHCQFWRQRWSWNYRSWNRMDDSLSLSDDVAQWYQIQHHPCALSCRIQSQQRRPTRRWLVPNSATTQVMMHADSKIDFEERIGKRRGFCIYAITSYSSAQDKRTVIPHIHDDSFFSCVHLSLCRVLQGIGSRWATRGALDSAGKV